MDGMVGYCSRLLNNRVYCRLNNRVCYCRLNNRGLLSCFEPSEQTAYATKVNSGGVILFPQRLYS